MNKKPSDKDERNLAIISKYLNTSLSCKQIAAEYDLSPASVCLILKSAGIKVDKKKTNASREATNLSSFGYSNPMFSPEIVKKREDYFFNTLGVHSPFGNKQVLEKCRETLKSRYGVTNSRNIPEVSDKIRKTCIKKYQGPAPACSAAVREKMSETNTIRYGSPNYRQKHISEETRSLRAEPEKYREYLILEHHINKVPIPKIAINLGLHHTQVCKDFKHLGIEKKKFKRSKGEEDIADYIHQISNKVVSIRETNIIDRELDLYVGDVNLAIEYNGNYWHSFSKLPGKKQRLKHKYKTDKCIDKGIKLLQIFESEWLDQRTNPIWKSIISANLGVFSKVYNARDLKLVQLDKKEAKIFLDENHLQGYTTARLYYGLKASTGGLISIMSFSYNSKRDVWFLSRFCNKTFCNVRGAASKLLKHFERNNQWRQLETFSDLRYSNGKVYPLLGFALEHEVPVRYYYTDLTKIYHRRLFQKQYLPKILGGSFNPKLTEADNVLSSRRFRILYDCGKLKFSKYNRNLNEKQR